MWTNMTYNKSINSGYNFFCRYSSSNFQMQVQEKVAQRCSVKKVFFEISQNLQENVCGRVSFLIKLQASGSHL